MNPAAPARLHRAARGRADLLRLLNLAPAGESGDLAALCGFEPKPVQRSIPSELPSSSPAQEPGTASQIVPAPLQAELYAAIDVQPGSDDDEDGDPLPSAGATVIDAIPESDGRTPAPEATPLVPARRMAAFLRRCLRHPGPSQQLDVARWVDQVARGRLPSRLPTRRLAGWHHGSAIAFDGDERQQCLFADMHALAAHAMRLGGGRVAAFWCDGRGHWWQARAAPGGARWLPVAAPAPLSRRHWLMAGEWQAQPRHALWRKLVAGARERGGSAYWLQPCSRLFASQSWQSGLHATTWDQGADLRLRRPGLSQGVAEPVASAVDALLASMSLAVRVEPVLLRAIRLALGLPIEVEAAAWSHQDVDSATIVCQIKPARVGVYREALRGHAIARRRELALLIESMHRHLSPLIREEEAALAADLAPGSKVAEPELWQGVARTLAGAPASVVGDALARYVRRVGVRAHPGLWAASPALAEAWVRAEAPALLAGGELPQGLPPAIVRLVLSRSAAASGLETWQLVQDRDTLFLQHRGAAGRQRRLAAFGPFRPEAGVILTSPAGERWTDVSPDGMALAELTGPGPWKLAAGTAEVTVARLERPGWAQSWAFDGSNIFAVTPPLGHSGASLWVDASGPLDAQHPLLLHGYPVHLFDPDPALFPGWRFGVDRDAGLFAELAVGSATQRFRWIPPGEFWMGSPEDEPGRYYDESPRHRVLITQGFWLADSACTVGLWHAVMGSHPGPAEAHTELPKTEVSFDDVQTFLQRLQALLPAGCKASLPSEAEWEYACRAGTGTAFHFGARISRKQVNFGASEQPELAERGESSRALVPVKSLPPNPWGLYEMHGNVLEWCADDWRDYAETAKKSEALPDPTGPVTDQQGAHRAVRGGSWILSARNVRSAYRGRLERGIRGGGLGFRVALRSTGPVAPEGPQGLDSSPVPEAQGPARRDAGPARPLMDRVREIIKPAAPRRGGRGKR